MNSTEQSPLSVAALIDERQSTTVIITIIVVQAMPWQLPHARPSDKASIKTKSAGLSDDTATERSWRRESLFARSRSPKLIQPSH